MECGAVGCCPGLLPPPLSMSTVQHLIWETKKNDCIYLSVLNKKYWSLSVYRCFIFNPSAWWELDLLLLSDQNRAPEVSHLAYKINLLVEFLNKKNYILNKIMTHVVNRTHCFMTRCWYDYRTANRPYVKCCAVYVK